MNSLHNFRKYYKFLLVGEQSNDKDSHLLHTTRPTLSFITIPGNKCPHRPVFAADRIAFSAKENPSADPTAQWR